MVEEVDFDGNGNIEFPEFVEMLSTNKEFLDAMTGADESARRLRDTVELTEGFFGEESVLTGLPATHSVRAVRYSDFFLLPVATFRAVVEQNDAMRRLVEEYAAARRGTLERKAKPSGLKRSLTRQGTVGHMMRQGTGPLAC